MATGSYEGGGIGGKIRRRPLRAAAAPATPYDRPTAAAVAAAAARGVKGAPEEGRTSGWLSKFVDPASRLITGSASKLFSSVFRKQLPALPPPETGGNVQSREEVPEVTSINPSLQTLDDQIGDGNNLTNNLGDKSLSELEKLLKQKTFTRKLSSEARKVLVESYVVLRRGDTTPGTRVAYRMTVRQLEALIRLSEAIARSHLDKVVLPAHVRMAVRLLKTSIISVESSEIDLSDFQDNEDGDGNRVADQETAAPTENAHPAPEGGGVRYS